MAKKKNMGKIAEESLENSSNKLGIFCFRVRDVNPMALKGNFSVPRNRYDFIFYYRGYLFPSEVKSTKAKSISMAESMIKAHQIKSLSEATKFKGVIPLFILNFRDPENTYAIHIDDFTKYKNIAENQLEHNYENKINRSSIPIRICEEIGIKVEANMQRTRYFYRLDRTFDELIERYGEE